MEERRKREKRGKKTKADTDGQTYRQTARQIDKVINTQTRKKEE